ncbi:hypothetical protein SAMN05216570_2234 [Dyella sp. OK004]|uniref:hypothetical protein n=1 Tax=Dyella sp. OK004 TaxID=1855292 RepID=UPI0008DF9535|nr:hypothetical protein [Dyella sp. OK004]SFS07190.1 hypothetical protein SAMN05216570_2234 [Dyella sp. OK004]
MDGKKIAPRFRGYEFTGRLPAAVRATHAKYPLSPLDRLLNDLQGNGLLMIHDEGLSRLCGERLREIRANALAQAAAAWEAESALRCVMKLKVASSWLEIPIGRTVRDHVFHLHEECLRWRHLAEHAALYLTHPRHASICARGWSDESRAKGELPL